MRWKIQEKSCGRPYWISGDCRFTILYSPKVLFQYELFENGVSVGKFRPFGAAKADARRRYAEELAATNLFAGVS